MCTAPAKAGRNAAPRCARKRQWQYGCGFANAKVGLWTPVFPTPAAVCSAATGSRLLAKHVATARQHCDSLQHKPVTPHVLRHTAAMELLQHGVDRAVIALWLGHESVETTQRYLHASLELKEQAWPKPLP